MRKTLSFLTAAVVAAGFNLNSVQAQEAPVQQQSAMAEAVLLAQLQIDAVVDGATAADVAARIVEALADQGYNVVDVSQTFLGRLRIVAESAADQRELIVSRTTGAVLRDRITATFDVGGTGGAVAGGATSGPATGGANGGITGGLTGGVNVDLGGSSGLTGGGTNSSVGASVSVGIGG